MHPVRNTQEYNFNQFPIRKLGFYPVKVLGWSCTVLFVALVCLDLHSSYCTVWNSNTPSVRVQFTVWWECTSAINPIAPLPLPDIDLMHEVHSNGGIEVQQNLMHHYHTPAIDVVHQVCSNGVIGSHWWNKSECTITMHLLWCDAWGAL